MLHYISCYNWKRNDFHYSGAYLFTSFVYCINVYWSVIHGIKRKPHLSVVWNWYHFVAIAILHQPRPTDSADINTRLQLSDTSSIPPMHGGFLLWPISETMLTRFPDAYMRHQGEINFKGSKTRSPKFNFDKPVFRASIRQNWIINLLTAFSNEIILSADNLV